MYDRKLIQSLVATRDHNKCVFCGKPSDTGHHILERRLWPKDHQGYIYDNLVSVCETCHTLCEIGDYTPNDCRKAAGLKTVVPENMYEDHDYDKWGNSILDYEDGVAVVSFGPLMGDEGIYNFVSKHAIIRPYVKYPRTYHLPWSNENRDDKKWNTIRFRLEDEVIVTEKMDGECTTLYNNYIHARSITGDSHKSQTWIRNFHGKIAHDIPEEMRICGENLYATHSIFYANLKSYFYGFSVWDKLTCLSWKDTEEWLSLLGIRPVPVIFMGSYSDFLRYCLNDVAFLDKYHGSPATEGYVIRSASAFEYKDFGSNVAKYVRAGHLQTKERWDTKFGLNLIDNWEASK